MTRLLASLLIGLLGVTGAVGVVGDSRPLAPPMPPAPRRPVRPAPRRPVRLTPPRPVPRILCERPASLRLRRFEDRSAQLLCSGRILARIAVPE